MLEPNQLCAALVAVVLRKLGCAVRLSDVRWEQGVPDGGDEPSDGDGRQHLVWLASNLLMHFSRCHRCHE